VQYQIRAELIPEFLRLLTQNPELPEKVGRNRGANHVIASGLDPTENAMTTTLTDSDTLELQAAWSSVADSTDATAQALLGRVNIRLNVAKALKTAYLSASASEGAQMSQKSAANTRPESIGFGFIVALLLLQGGINGLCADPRPKASSCSPVNSSVYAVWSGRGAGSIESGSHSARTPM
jgi:hypothetical protein